MKIIDLTQPWREEQGYPGDPHFQQIPQATMDEDGYRLTKYDIHSHLGTHLDAPSHILIDGKTSADFPLERFQGSTYVAPFPTISDENWIMRHKQAIQVAKILILVTGWSKYYGRGEYYQAFPVLPPTITEWLAKQKLQMIGIDAPSFDHLNATHFVNHELLLSAEILLLENLCHLEQLPTWCYLHAYPLPIASDGSPVRAVAIIDTRIGAKGEESDASN